MPFELELDEDEFVDPPPEEVEVCAGWVLEDVEPELEEFPPQAARPRAASTSRAAAKRRGDLVNVAFIIAPL
jgi:hypothetical protein